MLHHRSTLLVRTIQALALLLVLSLLSVPRAQATGTTPLTPIWHTTGSLLTARTLATTTRLRNGKVLVAGGYDNTSSWQGLTSAELYDPATGVWSATGSMAYGRREHTATLLPDGKVLVVGGNTSGSALDYPTSTELYDPTTGVWSAAGHLAQPRANHTATLLQNGTVLVVGGDTFTPSVASVELYDPLARTWSTRSSLPTSRTSHTATLLPDGQVLIVSGISYPTSWAMLPQRDALLYNPLTDTWGSTGSPNELHLHHTATLLPDGTVLVSGGTNTIGTIQTTATTEIYNPTLSTWQQTGNLTTARYGHTAVQLPDGNVFIVGGQGESALTSAERYHPTAGTWNSAGNMRIARGFRGATATLLADGNVLVIGGSSAEIYGLYRVRLPFITTGSS